MTKLTPIALTTIAGARSVAPWPTVEVTYCGGRTLFCGHHVSFPSIVLNA